MPELVRLYIRQVLIGWGIAALFVAGLIGFNVAGLRHLVLETRDGWIAGVMLLISNGVVFAGVQFGITIMAMAEDEDGPKGGKRFRLRLPRLTRAAADRIALAIPVDRRLDRR